MSIERALRINFPLYFNTTDTVAFCLYSPLCQVIHTLQSRVNLVLRLEAMYTNVRLAPEGEFCDQLATRELGGSFP